MSDTNNNFKSYAGLHKANEYDKPRAELLAEAMTELVVIEQRAGYIKDLMKENKELLPFLWTTLEGQTLPLHQIGDDHLKNIMQHLLNTGRKITPQIRAEAMSRNIAIPKEDNGMTAAKRLTAYQRNRLLLDGEIVDGDDD